MVDVFDTSIVEQIEIRMIKPSKFPVRFSEQKNSPELAGLKQSVGEHGLLQPILVRPLEHGFEIVAGHRRVAACRSLRWRFIACKIWELSDRQAYEIQLAENLQRKTMDPIEEAQAYQKYVSDYGWGGVGALAKKLGKSLEYVSHRMQLLKLPDGVREKVIRRDLSASQALELTEDAGLAEDVISNRLTVRQIRKIKERAREPDVKSKEAQILRKSTLSLKITMSRIDDLIEDAGRAPDDERARLIKFLMGLRQNVHAMIDDSLKYKKGCDRRS